MNNINQNLKGRRIIWQVFHFLLILFVYWILFEDGLYTVSSWFETFWVPGDLTRRILLFTTSFILFLRWGLKQREAKRNQGVNVPASYETVFLEFSSTTSSIVC